MEFGKFVTLVVDAIGAVLDIFLQSALSYLTNIVVGYVWKPQVQRFETGWHNLTL